MRRISLQGDPNFWDLGGYTVRSGSRVSLGKVFRSGRLDRLSKTDWVSLDELQLRTIVDLRSSDEREEAPDPPDPKNKTAYVSIPLARNGLGKEQVIDLFRRAAAGELDTHQHMIETYRKIPEEFAPAMKKLLHLMLDPGVYPILFHCTAGKDRTGYTAAVLLALLGADNALIKRDYLQYVRHDLEASAKRYAASFDKHGVSVAYQDTYPYLIADAAYIEAFLNQVDAEWGSIQNYIWKALDFSPSKQMKIQKFLLD